jgi:hypothetical protein
MSTPLSSPSATFYEAAAYLSNESSLSGVSSSVKLEVTRACYLASAYSNHLVVWLVQVPDSCPESSYFTTIDI